MKKIIAILVVIGLITATFYYLKFYYKQDNVNLWDLVPGNAVMVFESDNPVTVWNDFKDLPFWDNLSTLSELDTLNRELIQLDTLTNREGGLERLFQDRSLLLSLHKVSNTDLGSVFYIPLNTTQKRKILNKIFISNQNKQGSDLEVRMYEDFKINEIQSSDGKRVFSFFEFKNYFIGSFTSFLIDDVIRNISGNFEQNFKSKIPEMLEVNPIELDEGNLYIDMAKIPDLIRVFSDPSLNPGIFEKYGTLAKGAYYDIGFEGNRIFLNGSVSVPSISDDYFLSTFQVQNPQTLQIVDYLPGFTASFLGFTYDDIFSWRKSVDDYWQTNSPGLLRDKISFLQKYDLLERDLYDWIGDEMGVATLRSIDPESPDKLFFIKADKSNEAMAMLDELTLEVNHANGDTLLYEDYADRTIKKLNIEQFPAKVFGEEFTGFTASYYTSFEDYILIGNSFDVVKVLFNDVEEENTWGKSLKFIQFFDNIQKKANMTWIVNFSNAWNFLMSNLNKPWKNLLDRYDYQFKHFEYISVQFSNINNNFYTSAAIQHREQTSIIKTPAQFFREQVVVTDYPIITKPFVVRNHLDRSLEVVLQDSAKYLYLIDNEGNILWRDSIGDPVTGDLFQVDFYNNDKLQYFFATPHGLHVIDRNGDYISGFPVIFEEPIDLQWVNLIDYDKSKRYRFLLADREGKIFLFDKYGKILEGWDPIDFDGEFSSEPFHLRVGGRDCMINTQTKGTVNSMTRRGQSYEGFPKSLEAGIHGPPFIQRGTDFTSTLMHLVNDNGELVKINLNGKSIETKQLYRPGAESYFEIVPDVLNNTYIIARQDFNSLSVIRQDGEVSFEKELLYSDRLAIQYYNFSTGNEIFAVTDKEQSFTYLFDGTGFLVNMQPVESSHEIGLIYSEVNNNYKLYSCYGNQFSVSTFYRR